jgi:hypothetical protein
MLKSITLSAVVPICAMAVLLPSTTSSLAQAGSTGGTLGQTGKSASGDDASGRDRSTGRRGTSTRHTGPKQPGNECDRVAGVWQWKWLNETSVVTLNANGTGWSAHGAKSTWTCIDRTAVIRWPLTRDTMVLSADGKKLTGSNNVGMAVTGSRL